MPPAVKRDYGIILFDVASPKKTELLNGLLKFATYKWFLNSKSTYRLIFVNSAETKNAKNYPHIYTADNQHFNPKFICETVEGMQSGKSNWIDALRLGIKHLEDIAEEPGLVTLQLIFFTNLHDTLVPDFNDKHVKNVIENLKDYNIFLYIIGPEIQLPIAITNYDGVSKCMEMLKIDETQMNLVVAQKIVNNTYNSVMCNTKVGTQLLISFIDTPGSQPWKVPLSFGNNLSIPVDTCNIFRKNTCIKLMSGVPKNFVRALADDRTMEVEECEIIKGIVRHGKFLQMDDGKFKVPTERCFSIMGFTERKLIPESYILGEDMYYVMPSAVDIEAFQFFTHLVNVLHENDKYALVKRVYAKNTKGRYYVLMPNVDYTPKCLAMAALPFAGLLRQHKLENPKAPKEEPAPDDFHRFFDSLIVENTDSKAGISLGPTMMLDLHQQKIVDLCVKKYLNRDDLDMESLDICDHETPIEDNNFLENLRNSWPTRDLHV